MNIDEVFGIHRLTQYLRFGIRLCPSGQCSLQSQRCICWKRYMKFQPRL